MVFCWGDWKEIYNSLLVLFFIFFHSLCPLIPSKWAEGSLEWTLVEIRECF